MQDLQNEEVTEKSSASSDFFPKELTRATGLSRFLTWFLLIALPIVGFLIGYEKGKQDTSYTTDTIVFIQDGDTTESVDTATTTEVSEQMDITIYLLDEEVAIVSDCSAVKPVSYKVPAMTQIEDIVATSLDIIFADDLPSWMSYESVQISEGVATLEVSFEYALSSCESGHFMSVIVDTLTQYDEIEAVYFDVGDGVAREFPF